MRMLDEVRLAVCTAKSYGRWIHSSALRLQPPTTSSDTGSRPRIIFPDNHMQARPAIGARDLVVFVEVGIRTCIQLSNRQKVLREFSVPFTRAPKIDLKPTLNRILA